MTINTISHNGFVIKVYTQNTFAIFTFCIEPSLELTQILCQIKQNFILIYGVLDVVIGIDSITVYFEKGKSDDVWNQFYKMSFDRATFEPRHCNIEVQYSGEDIMELCNTLQISKDQLITMHTESLYYVAMIGFLPGFMYLSGGNSKLYVPRKQRPSRRVNAGDVAIANGFTGIYPSQSPGGWHIIGHTTFTNFDIDQGCKLSIGDTINFIPC